jgi:hypothetical protein
LGPAILGFSKAVADTIIGRVNYQTSLLKEEQDQQAGRDEETARREEASTREEALERA